MTSAPQQPSTLALGTPDHPVRIPIEHRLEACARLLGDSGGPNSVAARRMVSAASAQGIDLTHMWGVVDRDPAGRITRVREVCLVVPGSGKTAMLMVSHPTRCDERARELADRVACINAACDALASRTWAGPRIALAQALPEPAELWAIDALRAAGFRHVGDLAYLRRPARDLPRLKVPTGPWPAGIEVRPVRALGPGDPDRADAITALERSYIDTLDCPELCGLRQTADVLDSHRATGHFEPALWRIVTLHGEPHGLIAMAVVPELASAELIYIGLSPQVRGKGLGERLLRISLAQLADRPIDHVSCAVDLRNVPALKLYERLGFVRTAKRVALVRPIGG